MEGKDKDNDALTIKSSKKGTTGVSRPVGKDIADSGITVEEMWAQGEKLLMVEEQEKKKLLLSNIGTFIDPKKLEKDREMEEYTAYHNLVTVLTKADIYMKIQKLHSSQSPGRGNTNNNNSQSQMINNLISLSKKGSQSNFRDDY